MNTKDFLIISETSLKVKDLNKFFNELPMLGNDAKDFARDLADIRKQIPLEKNQWEQVYLFTKS